MTTRAAAPASRPMFRLRRVGRAPASPAGTGRPGPRGAPGPDGAGRYGGALPDAAPKRCGPGAVAPGGGYPGFIRAGGGCVTAGGVPGAARPASGVHGPAGALTWSQAVGAG